VTAPIRPSGLLTVADRLTELDDHSGEMAGVHLRRAVSGGYYALLHGLVAEAVARTVGVGPEREADRWAASRWYSHGDLKTVSRWVARLSVGQSIPDGVAPLLEPLPVGLVTVATEFVFLQDRCMKLTTITAFSCRWRMRVVRSTAPGRQSVCFPAFVGIGCMTTT
jgi:hypothetical protein